MGKMFPLPSTLGANAVKLLLQSLSVFLICSFPSEFSEVVLLLKFSVRGWQTKLEESVGGNDRAFSLTQCTVLFAEGLE